MEKELENKKILYYRLYKLADILIKKYNPCDIHKLSNGKIVCKNEEELTKREITNQLCCINCEYWSNGCTIKSLGCKLGLCKNTRYDYVSLDMFKTYCKKLKVNKSFYSKMKKLIIIANKNDLICVRHSFSDLIRFQGESHIGNDESLIDED